MSREYKGSKEGTSYRQLSPNNNRNTIPSVSQVTMKRKSNNNNNNNNAFDTQHDKGMARNKIGSPLDSPRYFKIKEDKVNKGELNEEDKRNRNRNTESQWEDIHKSIDKNTYNNHEILNSSRNLNYRESGKKRGRIEAITYRLTPFLIEDEDDNTLLCYTKNMSSVLTTSEDESKSIEVNENITKEKEKENRKKEAVITMCDNPENSQTKERQHFFEEEKPRNEIISSIQKTDLLFEIDTLNIIRELREYTRHEHDRIFQGSNLFPRNKSNHLLRNSFVTNEDSNIEIIEDCHLKEKENNNTTYNSFSESQNNGGMMTDTLLVLNLPSQIRSNRSFLSAVTMAQGISNIKSTKNFNSNIRWVEVLYRKVSGASDSKEFSLSREDQFGVMYFASPSDASSVHSLGSIYLYGHRCPIVKEVDGFTALFYSVSRIKVLRSEVVRGRYEDDSSEMKCEKPLGTHTIKTPGSVKFGGGLRTRLSTDPYQSPTSNSCPRKGDGKDVESISSFYQQLEFPDNRIQRTSLQTIDTSNNSQGSISSRTNSPVVLTQKRSDFKEKYALICRSSDLRIIKKKKRGIFIDEDIVEYKWPYIKTTNRDISHSSLLFYEKRKQKHNRSEELEGTQLHVEREEREEINSNSLCHGISCIHFKKRETREEILDFSFDLSFGNRSKKTSPSESGVNWRAPTRVGFCQGFLFVFEDLVDYRTGTDNDFAHIRRIFSRWRSPRERPECYLPGLSADIAPLLKMKEHANRIEELISELRRSNEK